MAIRDGDYFDGLIANQGDFNPFSDRGWKNIARRFDQCVDVQRPFELLDIGCGTGQSRQLYIKYVSRYVGIDLSEMALTIARRKFPESTWQLADACRLPFCDNRFDVVAFSSVLHHISDYRPALSEAIRVLRPGGQAFAFDPNLLHPAMALFRYPRSPLYSSNGVSPNERPLLPRDLRDSFSAAGFVDIQQTCMADLPYRAVAPKLLNACLGLYNAGDWLMERVGLGRWFGPFVITCARKYRAPL
ncbi:MAG TPA: methyltransferase domain-containing protein [Tepidisphaeraceae bacterium]|nr:methyltransferase domain-containing protein [Tepidisphaeraceae bacterium]